jgi:hypothetical protein
MRADGETTRERVQLVDAGDDERLAPGPTWLTPEGADARV